MHHVVEEPYQGRVASVLRLCPNVFDAKRILYIGANQTRFDFCDLMREGDCSISVFEVFPMHVKYLCTLPWLESVIHLDVRKVVPGVPPCDELYDVVFWWHGPEHIETELLPDVLARLELLARESVVLGCPWGAYPQDLVDGNRWERHVSHYDYPVFQSLGYSVECLGRKNVEGSNITAYKNVSTAEERRGLVGAMAGAALLDEPGDFDEGLVMKVDCWGPQSTRQAQPFNVQPDGDSAFWVMGKTVSDEVTLYLGEVELITTRGPSLLSGVLLSEDLGRILRGPGVYPLKVVSLQRKMRQKIGDFQVLAGFLS